MDSKASPTGLVIDQTTILSLLSTVAILATAYIASVRLLPSNASGKTRILFVWHAFDGLIHLILEASFLYNCFFSYTTVVDTPSLYLAPDVHFLGHRDRLYGSDYGTNPMAALWREYAKADRRWGGTDLGVISLELLTVFIGGPLALWVCYGLTRQRADTWFWMLLLATGELYGGFMTFAPEWLTGNPNLDGSNFMYLWVYLVFFNMLWVWIPFWILYEGYGRVTTAMSAQNAKTASKKSR